MSGPWVTAYLVLATVSLISLVLQLGLVRRISLVLEDTLARNQAGTTAVEGGVPRGTQLPAFEIERADGSAISFVWPLTSASIFLFMEPGCTPCERIVGDLDRLARRLRRYPLYIVTPYASGDGWLPESDAFVRLLDRGEAAARAFRNMASPQAFAVDARGVVKDRKIPASAEDFSRLEASIREEVVGRSR